VNINGWGQSDIDRLAACTGCPRDLVMEFCKAVDKRLYLSLSDEQRHATLHFHLHITKDLSEIDEEPRFGE
jgi:hypothetical protein